MAPFGAGDQPKLRTSQEPFGNAARSIQFYFWLHLHELNRKINKTAPGWDVAWVGIYHSLSASISMIISTCLLPTIAVLVLGLRIPSDIRLPDHRWVPWKIAVTAF